MQAVKGYFRPAGNSKKDGSPKSTPSTSGGTTPQTRTTRTTRTTNTTNTTTANTTPLSSRPNSRPGSRPPSRYPSGDFRNSSGESILDMKTEMMATHILGQQRKRLWCHGNPGEGVVLKKERGQYACAPATLMTDSGGFYEAVRAMNVRAAMTLNTKVLKLILNARDTVDIPLPNGLRLQVLPSLSALPHCQKHHFAAFIDDVEALVVWDDEAEHLLRRASNLEAQLLKMAWGGAVYQRKEEEDEGLPGKEGMTVQVEEVDAEDSEPDLEAGLKEAPRPRNLMNCIMVACTIMLIFTTLGLGWRTLAIEILTDPKIAISRLGLIALTPIQVFLALFFMQIVVTNVWQILGPTKHLKSNSKFYSGLPPVRLPRGNKKLPHVTIQCPVYKEGLIGVIQPTILSVKAAISTYEMQGGTANIFVNDDGMQLLPEEDARRRREFYEEHHIGWVSRPKDNPNPQDGEKAFLRRGKFKKASNMNYAFMITNKVEDRLLQVERDCTWNEAKEKAAYQECLAQILAEEEGRAWAEGNIRIGDYILLIDSDTRVPADCLLDAATEMEQSPEVGILQYSSAVMQVAHNFFENAVTWFTDLIYTAIRFGVASGDVAPFVGHNAILRWEAVQTVGYADEDGYEKFWSESHVSEDFDMALRLQTTGYIVRLGAYTGDGFKEGVSLTVYDELSRWEKYAYGCNELLFHPIAKWIFKGPFTPLFKKFIFSNMPITAKITICSYIGTYYAIGASWVMTVANFFIFGFEKGSGFLSNYYLDSFKVYFSLIIVFAALGNVSLAALRYRLGESGFIRALITNFKWIPLFSVFLGGLSIHVSQALLSHMFSIDMSWGATAKEVDTTTTFAKEWRKVLKSFKGTFLFCFLGLALIIGVGYVVPYDWQVRDFVAVFPLTVVIVSHFLLPVVLNPGLMMLKW